MSKTLPVIIIIILLFGSVQIFGKDDTETNSIIEKAVKENKAEEVIKEYTDLLKKNAGVEALKIRGLLYNAIGDSEKAIEDLEKVLKNEPKDEQVRKQLAEICCEY